jgi:hypothetical protein
MTLTLTGWKIVGAVGACLVGIGVTIASAPWAAVCIILGATLYGLASC